MKHLSIITGVIFMIAECISSSNGHEAHILRKRFLEAPDKGSDGPYLPQDVTPIGYHVWLQPFPEKGYFQGHVEVNISCIASTNRIVLHAGENINIGKAQIAVISQRASYGEYGQIKSVSILRVRRDSPEDWCEITVSEYLQLGIFYQLTLEFTSLLGNDSYGQGLVSSNYSAESSDGRWLVAVNTHQNSARKVFPCFDEFPYKAPFAISIGRQEDMRSLSNMALDRSEQMTDQPGWVWDHFKTSPPMSPFSVTLLIYDPEVILPLKPRDELGSTTLHIYGRTHLMDEMQKAGDITLKAVEKIQTYLRTKYPLPDLQTVFLPEFRQTHQGFGLRIFSERISASSYWPIILVFGMADQWLTHLTTPHFWSDATFGNSIETFVSVIELIETTKDTKFSNVYDWGTAYSVSVPASLQNNSHIVFDFVIKAWILRMLNYTLSENTLRSGLNSFLYDRSFKTYVADDFIAAVSEQARRDLVLPADVSVPQIVESWMKVNHFPVVTVLRDYKTQTAHVEQQIFIRKKSGSLSEEEKNILWYVPLVLLRSDQPQERFWDFVAWMKEEKAITLENMPPSDVFILINPEIMGFFVVNYDPTNWALIIRHLRSNGSSPTISATAFTKLMTDAFLLAYAGELGYGVPFDLSLILADKIDFSSWNVFCDILLELNNILQHTRAITLLEEYVWKLVAQIYEQYGGYSEEKVKDDMTVQGLVQNIMCRLGAEDCIQAIAAQYVPGNKTFSYRWCTLFKRGQHDIWESALLWALGHNDNRHLDKSLLTTLASCTEHKERMNQLLEAVLLKYAVNDTDMLEVIDNVGNHYLLFNYVSDKWFEIKKKYERKRDVFQSLVYTTTSKFVTADGHDLVTNFYMARERDTPSVLGIVNKALNNIVENSKWYDRSLPQIESWIRRFLKEK